MTGLLLRLVRQWIAGEHASNAIEAARNANSRGILALLNLLGEHIESREQIENTVSEYLNLLNLIEENKISSHISIKPSQLGVNLDFDYCLANYLKVAEACALHSNNYLWMDMEDSSFTQITLDLYTRVLSKYPNTGIAIQSYLRRSEADLGKILPLGAKVRLVKGAYNEPADIAFKRKKEVSSNYARLLEILFMRRKHNFFAVATHDTLMIETALELAKKNNATFEFEMLMGVRDNLKRDLVSNGHQVREYIPYGPQWLEYSMRRIREKKSNIFLLGRSLFTQ